jgi:dihydroorotate dehydrogenase electron transfer subunit
MSAGKILECFLEERRAAARLACPPDLIPAPGRYLLAHDPASHDPLPVTLFSAGLAPEGFLVAPPLPRTWLPGLTLSLRGPLGRGFTLPASARKIALLALGDNPAPLLSLLAPALAQSAAVTLVCSSPPEDLPDEVEVQPLAALTEVCAWADYLAGVATRESLPGWRERLGSAAPVGGPFEAQALVSAPVPCGGLADCGVCAVHIRNDFKLACKDGPVFPLLDLLA